MLQSRIQPRGFSLLELIVASSIFLILSGLIFSFFRYGTRAFAAANAKHGLQADALRVAESLQKELKRSTLASTTVLTRSPSIGGNPVRRDAMAFATLDNWRVKTNSINFDQDTGAPQWNRYLVYYATQEEKGRLVRVKVTPNPSPNAPLPMLNDQFADLHFDNPASNDYDNENPPYVVLSKNVESFSIDRAVGEGRFDISLKLKERHQKGAGDGASRRPFDFYELQLAIKPENSFPNDI